MVDKSIGVPCYEYFAWHVHLYACVYVLIDEAVSISELNWSLIQGSHTVFYIDRYTMYMQMHASL